MSIGCIPFLVVNYPQFGLVSEKKRMISMSDQKSRGNFMKSQNRHLCCLNPLKSPLHGSKKPQPPGPPPWCRGRRPTPSSSKSPSRPPSRKAAARQQPPDLPGCPVPTGSRASRHSATWAAKCHKCHKCHNPKTTRVRTHWIKYLPKTCRNCTV